VGAHITAIKAVDERTVVFELAKPSNLFLARLADVSCAPVIIHRDSWKADGSFDRPLGTGPYTFVEWRQGESVRLKRFEEYVPRSEPRDGYAGAKVAYAEEILVQVYSDRKAAFDALRKGTLDIVTDVQESERMWLEGTPGIAIHTTSTINFWNLLIQTRDPLLSDLRMRRAIAHAINLDYLAAVLTEGRQSANPSVVSQNSEFHSTVHDQGHEFNLQTSRELLRAAGYAGQPVEIQTNRDGYPEMYRLAMLIRSMLQAAGINAVLNIMPWDEQLNTHYRSGSFQLQAFGQGGRNHAALVYGKFIGSKDELARFQWDDPAIFALLNKAHEVTTPAEQQALFDELHLRMLEAVPTLALLNFEYHDAVRSALQGFHTTPFMRTTLWGVHPVAE
jgi:peptide/nickel transport system substrate-binding protein